MSGTKTKDKTRPGKVKKDLEGKKPSRLVLPSVAHLPAPTRYPVEYQSTLDVRDIADHLTFPELSGTALKVLLILIRCMDDQQKTWLSYTSIARLSRLSMVTVPRALKELNEKGLVSSVGHGRSGYTHFVRLSKIEAATETAPPLPDPGIPEGYVSFGVPGFRNDRFYRTCTRYLPGWDLVQAIADDEIEFPSNAALPARLIGLAVATVLGEPWNFMVLASKLTMLEPYELLAFYHAYDRVSEIYVPFHTAGEQVPRRLKQFLTFMARRATHNKKEGIKASLPVRFVVEEYREAGYVHAQAWYEQNKKHPFMDAQAFNRLRLGLSAMMKDNGFAEYTVDRKKPGPKTLAATTGDTWDDTHEEKAMMAPVPAPSVGGETGLAWS